MKYIIRWNAGYGDSYDIVEADSEGQAMEFAYEAWHDEVEANADYNAETWSEERAEELGVV